MKKQIWRRSFTASSIPKYPCPKCKSGHLALDGKVVERHPRWSELYQNHDYADFTDIVERFHFVLVCENGQCAEVVSVIGTSGPEPTYDDLDDGPEYISVLRPEAIFPPPPMIEIPGKMPAKALAHLNKAFQVCWADTNSAANCLRVSVEYLLDDIDIPRIGKSKSGKDIDLDLNGRIQIFEKSSEKSSGHASTFHALRMVGNLGSHGNGVKWDHFLDGLLIYEKALSDLLGNEAALFEEARARLLSLKKPKAKAPKPADTH